MTTLRDAISHSPTILVLKQRTFMDEGIRRVNWLKDRIEETKKKHIQKAEEARRP